MNKVEEILFSVFNGRLNEFKSKKRHTVMDLLESVVVGPFSQQNLLKNNFTELFNALSISHCEIKCSDLPERLDH